MEIIQSDLALLQNKLASQLKANHSYDQLNNAGKFEINERLLQNIGQSSQKLNQMLLPLLWECYKTGNWIGEPLFAFRDWLEDEILPHFPEGQRKYVQTMSFGVKNVLTTAHVAEKSGTPIVDDNGEIVTVERLLEEPTKVTNYAYHIATSKEPEAFIAKLPTHSRPELNKLRNEGEQFDNIKNITAETYYHEEGGYEIRIRVPDQGTLNRVERALKQFVQFSIPKSK